MGRIVLSNQARIFEDFSWRGQCLYLRQQDYRLREQARSHKGSLVCKGPCGSEPAREGSSETGDQSACTVT